MATFTAWTGDAAAALRAAYRMSQPQFAAALGVGERTIRRWDTGGKIRPDHQAALDTLLLRASDEVRHAFQRLRTDTQEDDVDRRKFMLNAVLGAGGLATLGLGDDATARAEWLLSGAGRPDDGALELIRSTLYQAMLLDDAMGSPAAQGMVIAQHQLTEALLKTCPDHLRPHMLSLHAEWIGFAGCLAWDQGDYSTAARLYNLGRDTAHEAEDDDGAGYMLAHLSQLAVWQKRPRVAVDNAVAAQSWVAQSRDIALRAYVSMRAAEAYAMARQDAAALTALDSAAEDLQGVQVSTPDQSRAYFATPAILESFRGECLSLIGRYAEAVEASRRAVDAVPAARTRDRAIIMLELERALIQLGEIDEAAEVVGQAAVLTDSNRSPRLVGAILDGRRALSPWAGTTAVQELDARLADRAMVLA